MKTTEICLKREILKTTTHDGYEGQELNAGVHGAIALHFKVGDKIEITVRKIVNESEKS